MHLDSIIFRYLYQKTKEENYFFAVKELPRKTDYDLDLGYLKISKRTLEERFPCIRAQ